MSAETITIRVVWDTDDAERIAQSRQGIAEAITREISEGYAADGDLHGYEGALASSFEVVTEEPDTDRECKHCGDEAEYLSTDNLCDGCVEYLAQTVQCPECGERVRPEEMNSWPNLAKPISMCDSCEHNARRSGWEPGQ